MSRKVQVLAGLVGLAFHGCGGKIASDSIDLSPATEGARAAGASSIGHFAGEDCRVCHGGKSSYGEVRIGGTVFLGPKGDRLADHGCVEVRDASGASAVAPVRCDGTFVVNELWGTSSMRQPGFPVVVALSRYRDPRRPERPEVRREGKHAVTARCTPCHTRGGEGGRLYVFDTDERAAAEPRDPACVENPRAVVATCPP